ncbi:epimerase [Sphingomonas oleivorans]|uniref:Epimerase n=1 Tax=Sphingomonas oleivorans TaxID=1735121 RepID=A0A2T5FX33_9SPHN|nr:aldehyde reductase [Sphingomonas oleivorans]PTQ10333.1 epimerase [Sphingomonas oleivorans]
MSGINAKPKVLVTGVTGFLGSRIAALLLDRGYDVRGSLRSMARADEIARAIRSQHGAKDGDLDFVEADLMHDAGWHEAAAGCTYAIHVASPFSSALPKHEDDMIVPAREGALRLLKAAKDAGVRRVVLTSSTAAITYGTGTPPYDEEDWSDVANPLCTPYYKSKTLAERAAWDFARANGLELAVINPGLILGPMMERDYSPSIEAVRKLLNGAYPGTPRFAFPIVDVRDVAEAHVRAMTEPAAVGERFIVGGPSLWFREIAAILRQAYPERARKIPKRDLPDWLMRFVSLFDPVVRAVIGDLGRDVRVSGNKARSVLKLEYRPVDQTIRDTAASLIELGLA